jgi:3-methylfumaryl-CoA hydratase
MAEDAQPFAEWIGRTSETVDQVTPRLAESFRAIFGDWLAPTERGEAPLCLHWCLSPAIAPMDALGRDGHPAKNRDLPPVPLPRRMWAGGRIETIAPLRIGDSVRRVSTIANVTRKQGRSGELWFVAVDHDYHSPRGPAIRERHDIVYRADGTSAGDGPPAEEEPVTTRRLEPSPVLLFRYSALTFNGHRIHYDLDYAMGVEGYPGLVVHGPLQATLLFNLAASRGGDAPSVFTYRGLSPAYAGNPLDVCAGADGSYWTADAKGLVHMRARGEAI